MHNNGQYKRIFMETGPSGHHHYITTHYDPGRTGHPNFSQDSRGDVPGHAGWWQVHNEPRQGLSLSRITNLLARMTKLGTAVLNESRKIDDITNHRLERSWDGPYHLSRIQVKNTKRDYILYESRSSERPSRITNFKKRHITDHEKLSSSRITG